MSPVRLPTTVAALAAESFSAMFRLRWAAYASGPGLSRLDRSVRAPANPEIAVARLRDTMRSSLPAAMGLFDLFRGPGKASPHGQVLAQLKKVGSDLSKPH